MIVNCMKCGIEMKEAGVFCENCLAEMEKYPVKPNITVQLPIRPAVTAARKKSRRQRHVKPEDQIRHLKKVRNWLCALLVFALLAFAASSALVLHLLDTNEENNIGQNYGTIDSTGND